MNGKLSDAERIVRVVTRTASLNVCAIAHVAGPVDERVLRVALNWLQKRLFRDGLQQILKFL